MGHCFTGLLVNFSFEKIVRGSYVFGHCPAANRWGTPITLDPPGQPPGRSYRHQGAMGQGLGAALAQWRSIGAMAQR
jgi:hypothetical protein